MIKQTHKDHEIRFDEKSEQWTCDSLGLTNKSLKAIRSAIDRADKKQRTMAIPAVYLKEDHWDKSVDLVECTIVLLRVDGRGTANIKIRGEDEVERVGLQDLYPPEHRDALRAYAAARRREFAAETEAETILEKLEHFTPELIRETVAQQADAEPAP